MAAEPFILYASKRFLDKASKRYSLGLIVRKPLLDIFKKMNVPLKELERDEAKVALEKIGESSGVTISFSQLIKNLTLAFFLPTGLLLATLKKIYYRSGIETEDGIILEFLAEIPRAFRTTLFYDIWLIVPKTEIGGKNTVSLLKRIVEETGTSPLNEEEWEDLQPIIEKLKGKLEVKGLTENLWKSL